MRAQTNILAGCGLVAMVLCGTIHAQQAPRASSCSYTLSSEVKKISVGEGQVVDVCLPAGGTFRRIMHKSLQGWHLDFSPELDRLLVTADMDADTSLPNVIVLTDDTPAVRYEFLLSKPKAKSIPLPKGRAAPPLPNVPSPDKTDASGAGK